MYLHVAARALPGVWLMGAPWTFAYLVAGLLGAERLRKRSRVAGDPELSAVSARLAGSLGIARRVTVGVCDQIAGPMLLGIARPLILLPASALAGASLMLLADLAARLVLAPAELPIGIVTALIGAPFFLYLLVRGRP